MNPKTSVYQLQLLIIVSILHLVAAGTVAGQILRISSYNWNDKPTNSGHDADMRAILDAIGSMEVLGNSQPIDLMAFQEGPESSGAYNFVVGNFEAVFGGSYSVIFSPADFFGCRTGFVYNDSTLTLVSSQSLSTGLTHNTLRATFRPVGGNAGDEFTIYSIHLKAGSSDASQRASEANIIRNNADGLGPGHNIIYVGDFNIQGSDEPAWANFASAGNGTAHDSINLPFGLRITNWNENLAFHPFHTQEAIGNFGGMDDRFDMQLFTDSLFDDVDLELIRGSVTTLGNNGTHVMNQGIMTGSGAADVQGNLVDFSDHLPVFADYEFGVVDSPANQMFDRLAVANYTVRPSGPRPGSGGIEEFQIEGDNNGSFASFGVIDFDLTGLLPNGEIAVDAEDVSVRLTQENRSFTRNGPFSVYLAGPSAQTVPIDSSIRYQTGNNQLDCLPAALSDGAIWLATYAGVGRDSNNVQLPDGTLDQISLANVAIKDVLIDSINSGSSLRLLIVPDQGWTTSTYAGFANNDWDGPFLKADFLTEPFPPPIGEPSTGSGNIRLDGNPSSNDR